MHLKKRLFFVLSMQLLLVPSSYGWGGLAHGVIALIAESQMSAQSKQQMKALIGDMSFIDASNWADDARETHSWKHSKHYHFKEMAGVDYWDNLSSDASHDIHSGDALRALLRAEDILRNPHSDLAQKKYAFLFLIHCLADLHQPLHVGYLDDAGGNAVDIEWYGYSTNLHSLWDTGILKAFAKKELSNTKPTPAQILQVLPVPTTQQINDWQHSSPMQWLNESLAARVEAYKGYDGANEDYYQKTIYTVESRILQAGYRLGAWLNSIFETPELMPPTSHEIRQKLLPFVNNDPTYLIDLNPDSSR